MTTSTSNGRRLTARRVSLVLGVLAVGVLAGVGTGPSAAAATALEVSDPVPLSSTPTTQTVELAQFDPTLGTLEQVTVTVAAEGTATVEVTNLTPAPKATTVSMGLSAILETPAVLAGFGVETEATETQDLAADAVGQFGLAPADDISVSSDDPADLAAVTGTGMIAFDLTGRYAVDVDGPAIWLGRGAASAFATVSIEYTYNVAPTAVDDAATVAEDATAIPIDVLANDSNDDGGPILIDSVTQPTNGAVVITGGGTGLTYQPNADFCNTQPGGTPDTFTYTLTPGVSTATVSVTVTCEDDSPVAVNDAATLAEDDPATPIDVLANDSNDDGGPILIDSVTQPTNGAVVITGSGTGLTYQPDPNYCNQPGGTPDTFTYTLTPGGSTATVSVTVTCVVDDPTAVDDSATVAEDSGATAVDVLANDIDPDPVGMTIGSVTQPTNGAVVITGGGTGLTYQPNANYCNSPPGGTPDTFTYTLTPGGSTATVSVTVTCVDDPPVAVGDTPTVAEDTGATAVDVLANDTDVDGGPISIASVTQPANGAVVITGGGTGLTYQPNANYCNTQPAGTPDTFTYSLIPGGSTATVSVTVSCVDDPPVAVADAATVLEDDPATAIPVLANDTDIDAGPISVGSVTQPANGTVVITNGGGDLTYQPNANYCNTQPGGTPDTFTYTLTPGGSTATVSVTVTCVPEDPTAVNDTATVAEDSGATTINVLANDLDPDLVGITVGAVTQPANGDVVINATATAVTYAPDPNYCNSPPGTTPDTFTYSLNPGGSTATVSVTVTCVDDPPVAVNDAATVLEDAAASAIPVLANDTDIDGGPIAVGSVTQPANGTVAITGGGTGLTYQPNANYCNSQPGGTPDTFTYTLAPGGSTATVTVTVTCANDAPVIALSGSTPTFTEGGPAVAVDDGLTVTDVDDINLETGTVTITANLVTGDTLTFTSAGGIADTDPAPGVLALTGSTTVANWQAVLRSVQFSSSSDNPTNATRTVSFTVNDGALASNTAPKPVVVVPVNDAPVLTQPDTAPVAYTEGAPATVITPNITATDVDSSNLVGATIDIGAGYAAGQDVLSLGTNPQNGITGTFDPATGTLTLTGTSSVANYQTALRDVRFANTSQDPTAGTRNVTFQVDDGPGPNDLSNIVSRGVTVTPVNDAPDAVNDSFTGASAALANTRLAVGTTTTGPHLATPGSVLANDTDVDSPASGFTAGPATISSANCAGCNNVTMETDGNFTYDPPADFVGTDTFTYTLNDNDPEAPPNQTDTATVSIEVVGPTVWYVDIDAAAPPAGQGGRSHSPFNTLAPLTTGGAADPLDGDGDIIFVGIDSVAPIAAYDSGLVLELNQKLWGEPFGLTVDPTGPIPSTVLVAATPGTPATGNPNIRNTAANGIGIVLANGVDLQRVNAGINGAASVTGIAGTAVTTATIGPSQLVQANTTGVTLTGAAGGIITIDATITGNTGTAVNVANRTSGTTTFSGTITGISPNAAITLASNTGATIAFTGAVNINPTTPTVTAFSATGGGTITATNATNQVASFTGTGVNLNGVTIGTGGVTFNTVTSNSGGAANGITLTNVGGGAFTVNGGAIIATTRALDVDGGAGNITVNASLTTSGALARSVEVTNRTSGTVDINGVVTDNAAGINLNGNTGAVIRFDGGVIASTGANPAFSATGGGTVTVVDPNAVGTAPDNTLTTSTGTALNVVNTNIGADDLNFRSIAASGGTNGVILNTTGSSGGLTVTGTGTTAGSGGTIQNTTGRGSSFINASDISLANMNLTNAGTSDLDADNSGLSTGDNLATNAAIHLQSVTTVTLNRIAITGGAEQGINGNTVTGFVLSNSSITDAGNEPDEDGIHFFNMAGTSSITNTTINCTIPVPNTTGGDDHLNLQMQSGTLSLTISGGSATNANKGSGYLFGIRGTATANLQFTNASSTGNFSGGIVADAFDNATMNLTVTNSTSSGNNDQLSASAGDNSQVDLTATGNTLSSVATADFVVISLLGSAFDEGYVFDARIQNNNVTVANGLPADGIIIFNAGGGAINALISGNTFDYAGTQRAIAIQGGQDGTSDLHTTITSNTIDVKLDGVGNAVNAILAQSQVADPSGASSLLCADIGGAGALSNTITHSLGGTLVGGDIRVRQRFGSNVRLPGYAGGATDTVAAAAYLDGRNTEVSPSTVTVQDGGIVGGAACTQPSP